jgi:hypothetical protein
MNVTHDFLSLICLMGIQRYPEISDQPGNQLYQKCIYYTGWNDRAEFFGIIA